MNLREKYQRFRAWQLNPFDYTNHSVHTERCVNCGTEFSDNFCPRCGQKAGVGPIGWTTVRQGVMLVWGMDSRSLGYSLLQLLLRPGYLISDYISGKRQVSFPPVKMLLIVAIGEVLVGMLLGSPTSSESVSEKERGTFYQSFTSWADSNPGWSMLLSSSLLLLPTWLLFRNSPQHRHHSLPEGFFIQVFLSSLWVLLDILADVVRWNWILLLLPIYYVVAYRQLFAYSWWGTSWRVLTCLIIGLLSFVLFYFITTTSDFTSEVFLATFSVSLIAIGCIALTGFLIDRRNRKKNEGSR